MSRNGGAFLERLAAVPVMAILRASDAGRFLEVGRVLYEAGVRAIEVTLTSRGALGALGRLRGALAGEAGRPTGWRRTSGRRWSPGRWSGGSRWYPGR